MKKLEQEICSACEGYGGGPEGECSACKGFGWIMDPNGILNTLNGILREVKRVSPNGNFQAALRMVIGGMNEPTRAPEPVSHGNRMVAYTAASSALKGHAPEMLLMQRISIAQVCVDAALKILFEDDEK